MPQPLTAPYRLELIGPPRVIAPDGSVVQLGAGKPMALFVYLALNPGGTARAEAANLFWSGAGRGQHSLRQALSDLRKPFPVDLFLAGSRLTLDPSVIEVDLDALGTVDDPDAVTRIVRGPFALGLSFDYSPQLAEWHLDREAQMVASIANVTKRVAQALREAERDGDARALIAHVARAGLAANPLTAAVFGTLDTLPESGAVTAGAEFLQAHVQELREDSPLRLVLLRGQPELDGHDDRVAVLEGVRGASNGEAVRRSLCGIFDSLASLPGGLGRSLHTDAVHTRLGAGETGQTDDEWVPALADALDAVLFEQPVILVVELQSTPLRTIEILARALGRGPAGGLLVVGWSKDAASLAGPGASALAAVAERVVQLELDSGPGPGASSIEPGSPASGGDLKPGESGVKKRSLLVAAVVLIAALALVGLSSGRSGEQSSAASSMGMLFCSDAGGAARYYYRDPSAFVERLGPDSFAACRTGGVWSPSRQTFYAAVAVQGADSVQMELRAWTPGPTFRDDWTVNRVEIGADAHVVWLGHDGLMDDRWLLLGLSYGTDTFGVGVLDLDTGERFVIDDGIRGHTGEPFWAQGGSAIYWRGQREGRAVVVRQRWPAGAPEVVLALDADVGARGIIGTDTLLVAIGRIGEEEDGSLEIGLVHLSTPDQIIAITDNTWNDHGAEISADGRYVAWISEELGHYEADAVILDRQTGERRRVRMEGRLATLHFEETGPGLVMGWDVGGDRELMYLARPESGRPIPISRQPRARSLGATFVPEGATGSNSQR